MESATTPAAELQSSSMEAFEDTVALPDDLEAVKREKDALYLRNCEESPLLRLPAELRYRIYNYALGGYDVAVVAGRYAARPPCEVYSSKSPLIKEAHFLALTSVCRQLHSETSLLPFGLSDFEVFGSDCIKRIAKKLQPEQRNAIHTFRFYCFTHGDLERHLNLNWSKIGSTRKVSSPRALRESFEQKFHGLKCVIIEAHEGYITEELQTSGVIAVDLEVQVEVQMLQEFPSPGWWENDFEKTKHKLVDNIESAKFNRRSKLLWNYICDHQTSWLEALGLVDKHEESD